MTDNDKAWIRSLPLLMVGGVAFIVGALIFFQKGDAPASISSMTLGVVLVSMWSVTAIGDWWDAKKRRKEDSGESDRRPDPTAP
jgi:membrane protein implicated in regulation of membrane protease activity